MSLVKGEVLSELQFYTVKGNNHKGIVLTNDAGQDITVSKQYAEKMLNSASDSSSTKKVTRTELVSMFLSNPRVAMTVNFNKKVKETDIRSAIVGLYPNKGGKLMSEAAFKKEVKAALNLKGEERTMVGRHYSAQDENGRVQFVDMSLGSYDDSKDYDTRQRLVDPRTLNWVVVEGVKYQVK